MLRKDLWKIRRKDNSFVYLNDKEALLVESEPWIENEILEELELIRKPKLIIIDGVDGVGKTSVVTRVKEQLEKEGSKVIWNKFKRKRCDREEFKEPSEKYEWQFRKEVVGEINRRLVTYKNENWIITDKSPYSEYFYNKTKEFERGLILPYENYLLDREIFKYKEIIDCATVIFLENENSWNNYYERESKVDTNKLSYPIMSKEDYKSMEKSFKEFQSIYRDTKKYRNIKIRNDSISWEKVYKAIKELSDEESFI